MFSSAAMLVNTTGGGEVSPAWSRPQHWSVPSEAEIAQALSVPTARSVKLPGGAGKQQLRSPQQVIVPVVLIAQVLMLLESREAAVETVGMAAAPYPQHSTLSSDLMPQVCCPPADIAEKEPAAGVACPEPSEPQQ